MRKYRNLTRVFSVILVLCMALSVLPITALAAGTTASTGKKYLSVGTPDTSKGEGWCMSDTPNPIELYRLDEDGTTGTKVPTLDQIYSGSNYIIFSTTGSRVLYNWQDFATAQISGTSGDTMTASTEYVVWTITSDDDGYTISSDTYSGTLVYLTDEAYAGAAATISTLNELVLSEENQTVFNIEQAGDGTFYITVGEDVQEKNTKSQYLSMGQPDATKKEGWYMSDSPNKIELYKVEDGTTGTRITGLDQLTSGGNYVIFSNTGSRVMSNWQDIATAQNSATSGSITASELTAWTITSSGDGYTISNSGYSDNTVYLTSDVYTGNGATISGFNELTLSTTKQTVFKITEVDGESNSFYITVEVEVEAEPEVSTDFSAYGADIKNAFNTSELDNTWVVVGGSAAEGGFDQVRGARNYSKHFEEYIRDTLNGNNTAAFHRFVINTAHSGLDLAGIVGNYTNLVTNYKPRVVAYLIGSEDYDNGSAGVEKFKENLKTFIENCLKEHTNTGFAVIQLPYATDDADTNENIELYIEAVQNVLETNYASSSDKGRIVVVNHYDLTKNSDTFKANGLQSDGKTLTAQGHVTLADQLVAATADKFKNRVSGNFPYSTYANWVGTGKVTELDAPSTYLTEDMLTVSAAEAEAASVEELGNTLTVTIPDSAKDISDTWTYEVRYANVTVSGTANGDSFTIPNLPDGDFVLVVRTGDGDTQLASYSGTLTNGTLAAYQESLSTAQEKIADLVASDTPITWLFMGDSITHGAAHTRGYDSVSELFDKYLDTIGRGSDVVINTAVSGASTASTSGDTWRSTINNLPYRLEAYSAASPIIVSIQLGTNDKNSGIGASQYKTNMQTIINAIHTMNSDAVIILRTPTSAPNSGWNQGATYGPQLEAIANDPTYSSYVIYDDQYKDMDSAMNTYSWLKNSAEEEYLFGDKTVHPGPAGHLALTRNFIKTVGLWTEDSPITNLYYKLLTESARSTNITVNENANVLTVNGLTTSGYGEFTVSAANRTTGETYTVSATGSIPTVTVPDGFYTVTVKAVATSSATRYTFPTYNVKVGNPVPSKEEAAALINSVTVTDENDVHDDAVYDVTAADIGDITPVNMTGEGYTVEVTVSANNFLTKYNNDNENTDHTLITEADPKVTFVFSEEDGAWELNGESGIQISVRCNPTTGGDEGEGEQPPAPPTPPASDENLPEGDTPLTPAPDDGDTDIEDGDTPLAPAPDKGDTDIEDGDTPLDSTPKTGDEMMSIVLLWVLCTISAFCLGGMAYCGSKSGKHSK